MAHRLAASLNEAGRIRNGAAEAVREAEVQVVTVLRDVEEPVSRRGPSPVDDDPGPNVFDEVGEG